MGYEHLERDFVTRTLEILDQYDRFDAGKSQKREVTILVNSLLGLIIVPKERGLLIYLPNERIEQCHAFGLSRAQVIDINIKTVKDLMIALRHSAAHFDVRFEGSKERIEEIIFSDSEEQGKVIARFTPENLRLVVAKIGQKMVENFDLRRCV